MGVIFDKILGRLRQKDESEYGTIVTDLDVDSSIDVIVLTNTPAVGPALGDKYLIDTVPTGVWVGHQNQIAEWDGAAWVYTNPLKTTTVYATSTGFSYLYKGVYPTGTWSRFAGVAIVNNGNIGLTKMAIGSRDNIPMEVKTNNATRFVFRNTENVSQTKLVVDKDALTSYTGEKFAFEVGGGQWFYGFHNEYNAFTQLTDGSSTGSWLFGDGTAITPNAKLFYDGSTGFFGINTNVNGNAVINVKSKPIHNDSTMLAQVEKHDGTIYLQVRNDGMIIMPNTPTFADNAAAVVGGLTAGMVYKTATGELRIVV